MRCVLRILRSPNDFCNSKTYGPTIEIDQFTKLFYSLIGDTDTASKKLISSKLARNHNTPRPIAYYLAMEPIVVAAPTLAANARLGVKRVTFFPMVSMTR